MGIKRLLKILHFKPVSLKEGCPHCNFLATLGEVQSNREYWIITEIFVHLHDGKCYCTYVKDHKGIKV